MAFVHVGKHLQGALSWNGAHSNGMLIPQLLAVVALILSKSAGFLMFEVLFAVGVSRRKPVAYAWQKRWAENDSKPT